MPGSTGHKVPVISGEDEDAEGRSDNERLVEEGIATQRECTTLRLIQAGKAAARSRKKKR